MLMKISFVTFAFATIMRLLILKLLLARKNSLEIKSSYVINVIPVFIKDATNVNLLILKVSQMEIGSVSVANIFNNSQKLIQLTYVAIFAMTSRVLLSNTLSKRHKDKVGVIFAASIGHLKYGLSMMTPVKLSLKSTLIVLISHAISAAQRRILEVQSNVTIKAVSKVSM